MNIVALALVVIGFLVGFPVGMFAERCWRIKANAGTWNRMLKHTKDEDMEAVCLKAHREGRSRPLREFIDTLKDDKDMNG